MLKTVSLEQELKSNVVGIMLGMGKFVMFGIFGMFFTLGALLQRDFNDNFSFKDVLVSMMCAMFGMFAIGDT